MRERTTFVTDVVVVHLSISIDEPFVAFNQKMIGGRNKSSTNFTSLLKLPKYIGKIAEKERLLTSLQFVRSWKWIRMVTICFPQVL